MGDGSRLLSQGNQPIGEIGTDRVSEGFNRPLQELDRSELGCRGLLEFREIVGLMALHYTLSARFDKALQSSGEDGRKVTRVLAQAQ